MDGGWWMMLLQDSNSTEAEIGARIYVPRGSATRGLKFKCKKKKFVKFKKKRNNKNVLFISPFLAKHASN